MTVSIVEQKMTFCRDVQVAVTSKVAERLSELSLALRHCRNPVPMK